MDTMVSRTLSIHQEHELLLKLEAAGLTGQLAQRVIDAKDNTLAVRIIQLIGDIGPQVRLVKTLKVTCPGNATASQLIAQGEYTWVNPNITDERFPIQPHDPFTNELELFQFIDRDPSWDDVLTALVVRNLTQPTYEHGLYLGIQHRDEHIVVPHEPVQGPHGSLSVLVLRGDADHRELSLYYTALRCYRSRVFAGVRKQAS